MVETTRHHLYFPKRQYRSQLERDFRDLCCHIVPLPRQPHDVLHRNQLPPNMPLAIEMVGTIRLHIEDCFSCRVKLRYRDYLNHKPRRTP